MIWATLLVVADLLLEIEVSEARPSGTGSAACASLVGLSGPAALHWGMCVVEETQSAVAVRPEELGSGLTARTAQQC